MNDEVLALRNDLDYAGLEAGFPVQKKGLLGALQKKNFPTLQKTRFFCTF